MSLRIFVSRWHSDEGDDLGRFLAQALGNGYELVSWRHPKVEQGSIPKALCEEVRRADAALIVLLPDGVSETNSGIPPWDTTQLGWEAGLCTGMLGKDRVLLICPADTVLSPDFANMDCLHIPAAQDGGAFNIKRSELIKRLQQWLERLASRTGSELHPIVDSHLGFRMTLSDAYTGVQEAVSVLSSYASTHSASLAKPIAFDSMRSCISTYKEALEQVQSSFSTTTFLFSGFWANNHPDIVAANSRLLTRLAGKQGAARRLFLLGATPTEEIDKWQDEHIRLAKYGDQFGRKRLEQQFNHLYSSVKSLMDEGCETKVVFDEDGLYQQLPAGLNYDYNDSELAIYDDWRVDLFRGAQSNSVCGVECYTPLYHEFYEYRNAVANYFDRLWQKARPMEGFLDRVKEAVEAAASRIDYQPSWLARYDLGLPEPDQRLKIVELSRVKEELKHKHVWGNLRSYLDVGTCTGRYPISLRGGVCEDGSIIGVDNDIDAVRFSRWNVERECEGDGRITIYHMDFCAEGFVLEAKFDLVTCMLGTPSHFGRNRLTAPPYNDTLQQTLRRFKSLLTDNGTLFLSIWSEEACKSRSLLSIYSAEEVDRVIRWTPSRREMQGRLRAAGLDFERPFHLEERLDLYCCRPAQAESIVLPPRENARRREASESALG